MIRTDAPHVEHERVVANCHGEGLLLSVTSVGVFVALLFDTFAH